MFRSKVKWYEYGERSSKYFFALEKAKYNAKTCYKMINLEGEEVELPEQILEHQRSFYKELYEKEDRVNFTMQNNFGVKVPEQIKEQQSVQITIEDLQEAIMGMNNDKTPGKDGIPIDFYKVF